MLGDLVASLLAEDPGVGVVPAEQADVLICGPRTDVRALLGSTWADAVVVLRDGGRRAELLVDLGEATPGRLVAAVRAAAALPWD
jgi:hypothetical protein